MNEPDLVDTTCPRCGWTFEAEGEDVLCPECEHVFRIDDEGRVTEDPERESAPLWEVNADGELGDEPLAGRCPRCGAAVELNEVGAVVATCARCRKTVAAELLFPDPVGLTRDEGDWEYEEYCEEEEEFRCPACGFEGDDRGHEVISHGPHGSLLGCFACGWKFEVPEILGDYDDPLDHDGERAEVPRTVVVSPCGQHDCTRIGDAVRSAWHGTLILVRPGLYEESLSVNCRVKIVADGPAGDVVLADRFGPGLRSAAAGVVVRGLTIRDRSSIRGTGTGAVDVPFGKLLLEDCAISSAAAACVAAHGWSEVTLRRCILHDGQEGGLRVDGRAKATMEDCDVEDCAGPGVLAEGGRVEPHRCRVRDGGDAGLCVAATGNVVTAHDCDFSGNEGPGVVVHGHARLLRCRARANRRQGVRVGHCGLCSLDECDLASNGRAGVAVARGSKLVARGCRIREGRERGALVRGTALLERCDVGSNAGAGVAVNGGRLALVRCRLHDGAAEGLLVTGNAAARVEGCEVVRHAGANVAVDAAGEFLLRDCRLHDGRGAGLTVRGGALGLVERCEVIGNARSGIVLGRGASTTLRSCLVGGQARLSGVVVRNGASGRLEDRVVVGNGLAGVEARGGGRAHLLRCHVHRNDLAGVWAHGRGAVLVEDCDLSDNRGGELEAGPRCRACRTGNGKPGA